MAGQRPIFEQSTRTSMCFGPERGRAAKIGMYPMHPSFFGATPAHSPSREPCPRAARSADPGAPGYGTLAGGWEGERAGRVFKHWINPMHPSRQGQRDRKIHLCHCEEAHCATKQSRGQALNASGSGLPRRPKGRLAMTAWGSRAHLPFTLPLESPRFVLVSVSKISDLAETQAP